MRAIDNDALICDFAQYYHVLDYNELPIRSAAVLACGLPESSRIMKKLSGQKFDLDTTLRIAITDVLRSIEFAYYKTHSKRKINKPKSLMQALNSKPEAEVKAFDTAEGFEEAKKRIISGEKQNGE